VQSSLLCVITNRRRLLGSQRKMVSCNSMEVFTQLEPLHKPHHVFKIRFGMVTRRVICFFQQHSLLFRLSLFRTRHMMKLEWRAMRLQRRKKRERRGFTHHLDHPHPRVWSTFCFFFPLCSLIMGKSNSAETDPFLFAFLLRNY
jgi:hypothetical protein